MRILPFQRHCRAGHGYQDHGLSAAICDLKHLTLQTGEQQVFFIAACKFVAGVPLLSLDAGIQSHHRDNHIADLADCFCFGNPVIRLCQSTGSVLPEVAGFGIINLYIIPDIILNAFQHCDIAGCSSFIVAHQRFSGIRIRTDHADRMKFALVKRKEIVLIFQKDKAFLGNGPVQRLAGSKIYLIVTDFIQFFLSLIAKDSQLHPTFHQVCHRFIQTRFIHIAAAHRISQIRENAAAV